MKKMLKYAAAFCAVAAMATLTACSGSKKDNTADSDSQVATEEAVPAELRDSLATFFNDPANKSDVATDTTYAQTASGLKYVMVREGKGAHPTATDVVTVQYQGQLLDGTVFDSSYDRGEPAAFPLNRVIPGWTEGLQLMSPGGEAIFYIPSDLGYGEAGAPGVIPPNADLIFKVELLNIGE